LIGTVAERLTEFCNRGVEARLCIDKRLGAPQLCAQLVARHDVARMTKQHDQHAKRQVLNLHARAIPAQLSRSRVDLEFTKFHRRQ